MGCQAPACLGLPAQYTATGAKVELRGPGPVRTGAAGSRRPTAGRGRHNAAVSPKFRPAGGSAHAPVFKTRYNGAMQFSDTIAAVSSAPGPAWRGIIRLSGPDARAIARAAAAPPPPTLAGISYHTLTAAAAPMMLVQFAAPRSFTGEHIAELHLPGSPALLRMVMHELLAAGARQAEPGEFTARAFYHGKIDLTAAEGIAATISAGNLRQLRAAGALRDGKLHGWCAEFADQLADVLALLEAGIDFSDEPGMSFIDAATMRQRIGDMIGGMVDLRKDAVRWERLDALPLVALAGRPNVGKSSLLNRLAGTPRAIVSPQAGATRDQLHVTIAGRRGDVRLVDTPGVETADMPMTAEMAAARRAALAEADLVLLITDPADSADTIAMLKMELPNPHPAALTVLNKCDLLTGPADARDNTATTAVSALTGQGIGALQRRIDAILECNESTASHSTALNARHLDLLNQAVESLHRAAGIADAGALELHAELLASELRQALDALGGISGRITSDDVLGRIFGAFCIGK